MGKLQVLIPEVGSEMLDVEIRELKIDDQVGMTGQLKAEQSLIALIKSRGGELLSQPYALSDGTRIIRAGITVSSLKEISNDTLVDYVSPTAFYMASTL